jgi:hypothetical protein
MPIHEIARCFVCETLLLNADKTKPYEIIFP